MPDMSEMLVTAIDADVASFFSGQELSVIFTSDVLRAFLVSKEHTETDVTTVMDRWQILYLDQGKGDRWRLNARGSALVQDIVEGSGA